MIFFISSSSAATLWLNMYVSMVVVIIRSPHIMLFAPSIFLGSGVGCFWKNFNILQSSSATIASSDYFFKNVNSQWFFAFVIQIRSSSIVAWTKVWVNKHRQVFRVQRFFFLSLAISSLPSSCLIFFLFCLWTDAVSSVFFFQESN